MGSLPVIYQPFGTSRRSHWWDRGAVLDFLESGGATGRWLDFGPGDGWPSLAIAPHVESVTGVNASARRVRVCEQNAERHGIRNFRGVHVLAGRPLPFPDESFDVVVASSSLEQKPDPLQRLRELNRVLVPGGRLRMRYEGLSEYRGREGEAMAWRLGSDRSLLHVVDRHLSRERATYYNLWLSPPLEQVRETLGFSGRSVPFKALAVDSLEALCTAVVEATTDTLLHPSGGTWIRWLREAGSGTVMPTHGGGPVAARLFDTLPEAERPVELADVNGVLRPIIRSVAALGAPEHLDPPLTAIN